MFQDDQRHPRLGPKVSGSDAEMNRNQAMKYVLEVFGMFGAVFVFFSLKLNFHDKKGLLIAMVSRAA